MSASVAVVAAGVEVEGGGRIWGWERRGSLDGALCWEPALLAAAATKGREVRRRRRRLLSRLTGALGREGLNLL